MSLAIVPVRTEHVTQIWDEPAPFTFRGLSVVDGERVLGVTGVYADSGRYVLVAKIADDARAQLRRGRHVRTLLTAARRMLSIAKERDLPVHAVPDPALYGSENLLRHLGFAPLYKDTWEYR